MKKQLLTALLLCSLSGCGDGGPTDTAAPIDQTPAASTPSSFQASLGPDMTVLVGQTATIVGTITPNNSPGRCWSISQPPGSTGANFHSSSMIAWLTPDIAGIYRIALSPASSENCRDFDDADDTRAGSDEILVTALGQPPQEPPPPPAMTTLHFEMGSANGTVGGNFTLPVNAAPTSENRGGLQNKIYTPVSWLFEVHAPVFGNDKVFDASDGHTAEWCVGTCTFLSPPQVRMDIKDGKGGVITFSYFLTGTVTDLPTLQQIGAFEQGILRQDTGFIIFDEAPSLKEVP